ncbi:MAG: helix-turn-helix domain-containing protein [Bacteroidota bacterium]|nr:helix-turn-helix domain-containing protein [Bacteroidota bacterium]
MAQEIKKYTFSKKTDIQIEVVPLNTLTTEKRPHLVNPHRTNFYHIFLFKNCQPKHLVDFKSIHVKPYSILFIDKERVHQFDQLLHYDGDVIIFTDNFYCQTENDIQFLKGSYLFNDIQDNCLLTLEPNSFQKLYHISKEIDEEIKQFDSKTSPTILKNLLQNFLLTAEREKSKNGNISFEKNMDFEYSTLFKDLIERHYKTKRNVAYYAQQLAISERRLGQATHLFFGKLPKEMINERLTLEAKRLLVYGNHSIKEIAYDLGFEEPTNFIKYFKNQTSQTPLEFREIHLKK